MMCLPCTLPVASCSLVSCRCLRAAQPAECLTLLYSPAGDPLVERLMADVRAGNVPPLSAEEVRGFADPQEVSSGEQVIKAQARQRSSTGSLLASP